MIKLNFICEPTPALAIAMRDIENTFPCFTDYDMTEDEIVITIQCRAEDENSIKNRINCFA